MNTRNGRRTPVRRYGGGATREEADADFLGQVMSVGAEGSGGTVLVVPLSTAAYLDGLAKPVRIEDETIWIPVEVPGRERHLRCATRFVISPADMIESWSHDGNDCVAAPPT